MMGKGCLILIGLVAGVWYGLRMKEAAALFDIIGALNDNSLSFDGAIQTCEEEHEGRARVLW